MSAEILSHSDSSNQITFAVQEILDNIDASKDLQPEEKATAKSVVDDLKKFDLGRFLLLNRGLNGYWTHQIVYEHPLKVRQKDTDYIKALTPLENEILNHFPTILATQERFRIFQTLLNGTLKPGGRACSMPCGLMADLVTLDPIPDNVQLIGVDLDQDTLTSAKEFAQSKKIENVDFVHCDAWTFRDEAKFDVLVSNGLNIYVENEDKELKLYKTFRNLLKTGGTLITSFLTPPPAISAQSEWKLTDIDTNALMKQKLVFSTVLGAKWQNFRSSHEMVALLRKSGFENVVVHWDKHRLFPSIQAEA